MMSFEILKKTGNYETSFILKDADVGFANALRKVVLSEVPNIAVADNVAISINTSSMHNEFMAKRITLIPLCFDEDEVENAAATVKLYKFLVDKRATTLNSEHFTTDDIVIQDMAGQVMPKEFHSKIFPHDPITKAPILIAWLKQGEHIKMEFTADVGIAGDHTKYSPVSTCTYFNTLDDDKVEKERVKLGTISNKFETLDKYRLFKVNEYGEPTYFTFKIVSECRLSVSYIVDKALRVLQDKMKSVPKKTTVDLISDNLYALTVKGEGHTVGNFIHVFVYNHYVRHGKIVDFIGYFQPHPLENEIIIKVRFLENMDNVERFWDEATRLAGVHVENMRLLWSKAKLPTPKKTTKKKTTSN